MPLAVSAVCLSMMCALWDNADLSSFSFVDCFLVLVLKMVYCVIDQDDGLILVAVMSVSQLTCTVL